VCLARLCTLEQPTADALARLIDTEQSIRSGGKTGGTRAEEA
jgi:hypothetical protein